MGRPVLGAHVLVADHAGLLLVLVPVSGDLEVWNMLVNPMRIQWEYSQACHGEAFCDGHESISNWVPFLGWEVVLADLAAFDDARASVLGAAWVDGNGGR
jgi:hypothetical protein